MLAKPNVSFTVGQLAEKIGATVARGDSEYRISALCSLENPQPNAIAFSRNSNLRRIASLESLGALIAPLNAVYNDQVKIKNLLLVKNPQVSIISLSQLFYQPIVVAREIHPTAVIDASVNIDPDVAVGAYSVIGANCKIGAGTTIHPHVVIYAGSVIGRNCVIHAGAVVREGCTIGDNNLIQNGVVIGAEGFGYVPSTNGLKLMPHSGTVILENNIDVGANACIDRAALGETRIGENTKIDNLAQIGHNVIIGRDSLLCGQVGVAGSVEIGQRVVLGGQVGVADHMTIASDVRIAGHSGVTESIREKGDYAGYPILPASKWRRCYALLTRLPKIIKKLDLSNED